MSHLPFDLPAPLICLAPMDGYTDTAFRQLVKELNSQVLVFTEMVSADAVCHLSRTTARRFDNDEIERPLIIQLFGKNVDNFAHATQILSETKAGGIDINMGCPAKKVVKSGHGSALMRDPELGAELVRVVKSNTGLPVSVKTRLGWDDSSNLINFAQQMQAAGADMITVHGRTYQQAFGGEADWEPIYELKKNLDIPVIGNGDVKSKQDADTKLQNLDGVMIGRAAFGDPFLFCDFPGGIAKPVTLKEKLPWILRHCELAVQHKGQKIGMNEMRKHLVKYAREVPKAARYRARLVQVTDITQVAMIFEEMLWELENDGE